MRDERPLSKGEQHRMFQAGLSARGHRTEKWEGEVEVMHFGVVEEGAVAEINLKVLSFDFHCPCGSVVREQFAHTSLRTVTVTEMRECIIPRLARFLDEHIAEEAARLNRRQA